MKKLLILIFVLISCYSYSQVNPWKSIGKEAPEILTLSDGKYPEIFENDSIRIINGIVYNTITKKVIGFIETDTLYSEATLEPEIVSRWLSRDPLAAKFPSMSPYNFVANNPIFLVDPDGRVYRVHYKVKNEETGKVTATYVDFNGTKAITESGAKYVMGSNTFVDDVVKSYNYVVDNGADTKGAMKNLATRDDITNVKHTSSIDGTLYHPEDKTIEYNPNSGLDIDNKANKGVQSPAIGFLHESAHRFIELTYSEERKKELEKQSGIETDVLMEEFEVIDNFDKPAVLILKKLGKNESYRISYGWDSIDVGTKGPTSLETVKRKERKKLSKNRDQTIEKKKETTTPSK